MNPKRLVVLGAAESGIGAAVLAQRQGFDVFVSDRGRIKDSYKRQLTSRGLSWEEGRHTPELILNADEVVKSPGIPDTAPIVAQLHERHIPVISEIEFAGRYSNAKMLCITGSNGKTTTTSLIYHILKKGGFNVGLAGNIGRSLALQVAEGDAYDWYVLEISSFQLDGMFAFRADIAVLLNITPDHLDRYGFEMQNYVDSKMRLLRNQRAEDSFIYWAQDEYIPAELVRLAPASRLLPFSDAPQEGAAAFVQDGILTSSAPAAPFSVPVGELSLRGRHNLRNCMAAVLAAQRAGVPAEAIRAALSDFPGVEHRLEFAGSVGGVTYINDSKATNVDACYCALDSVDTPVVLILGGLDKGNDYSAIAPLVRAKCRALVFLGADNAKLHSFFDGFGLPVRDTSAMADCVAACAELARPGDTVLLSPCCASFDLFANMGDRGRQFKDCVRNLQ
ncbi:MAG: UDP-N-acetylmuramoyl-L-alanine--D-glutamate ligase [Alloprevotella sp.]|nr:UDP-N-acetylmuramoyl-L-alanine--D-glutamate ligase [Alloprevotella sp.]